jgi:hypothetical protein
MEQSPSEASRDSSRIAWNQNVQSSQQIATRPHHQTLNPVYAMPNCFLPNLSYRNTE